MSNAPLNMTEPQNTPLAETKRTPGPWHYGKHVSLQGTRLVYGPDDYLVADAGRIPHRADEEMEANARLIAAAPTMYDLLHRLLNLFPNPTADSVAGELVGDVRELLKEIDQ